MDEHPNLQKTFEFVVALDRLKAVLRKTKPVGLDRYENSAEHSWQVCVLALLMADHTPEPVKIERVIELLLVHDIPEIECDDEILYERDADERSAAEATAAKRIFGTLSPAKRDRLMALWDEFNEKRTPEARFAHSVDRLMPVLQNLFNEGQSWHENQITGDKVAFKNSEIGETFPDMWPALQELIAAEFASERSDTTPRAKGLG